MKKLCLLYILPACLLFVWGCSPKDIIMTEEFRNNNRSSKFNFPGLNMELLQFLDYRVYSSRTLNISYNDSTINGGILFGADKIERPTSEKEFLFGVGSDTCTVHYYHSEIIRHHGRSAVISVVNLFSKKANKSPQETSDTHLADTTRGTIYSRDFDNSSFSFENIKFQLMATGELVIDNKTFLLKPIISKNNNFQGLKLVKNDTMYAAISKPFFNGDKIFLYTRATTKQQLVIAAYFAVIERNL